MADQGSIFSEEVLYSASSGEVIKAEFNAIGKVHRNPTIEAKDMTGVAISGGGIRSASFALGVVQKLAHDGWFDRVHYLSTVSGGGYTGSSLSWFLSRGDPVQPCYTTSADKFPYLGGAAAAVRRDDRASTEEDQHDVPPPDGRTIVDFIRQRSSYLVPGRSMGLLSAIGIVLRSVLVSLLAYIFLFTLFSLALRALEVTRWLYAGWSIFYWAAIALVALLPVVAFVYSLAAPAPRRINANYWLRRRAQAWIGGLLTFAIIFALFGFWLELATHWAAGHWLLLDLPYGGGQTATAAATTMGGALLGLLGKKLAEVAPRFFAWLVPVLPPVALLLLLAGLGALGWLLAGWLVADPALVGETGWTFSWWWLGGGVLMAVSYLLWANLNLTGLHRFYRDRLMECFMPDLDDIRRDEPSSMTTANGAELWKMFGVVGRAPFHLINTNVVMMDSAHARYRSRHSDSFILSPGYCGSEATGWARTDQWMNDRRVLAQPIGAMTLATAMAISGAALNPNTGADGKGFTKDRAVSAVLTILNIRLGYWATSPRRLAKVEKERQAQAKSGAAGKAPRRLVGSPPNFLLPGLLQGIAGVGRSEKANWIELTDGGHFDNTGLYELVRRKLGTIIFIDGTEDGDTTFASFANAANKIYIDFNVKLRFDAEAGFIPLMRGADLAADPLNAAYKLADRGFAIAEILYPDGAAPGTLYYIKSTLTKGLPEALYSYRADNPTFPAETTADQFFDEEQFEAYRALGFAVTGQFARYLKERDEKVAGGFPD